jgi:hypothetical protein
LAYLREVDEPVFLHFEGCCFSSGSFKSINGMSNLVQLVGDGSLGQDDLLADISTLPGLEELAIGWSDVTARGLSF